MRIYALNGATRCMVVHKSKKEIKQTDAWAIQDTVSLSHRARLMMANLSPHGASTPQMLAKAIARGERVWAHEREYVARKDPELLYKADGANIIRKRLKNGLIRSKTRAQKSGQVLLELASTMQECGVNRSRTPVDHEKAWLNMEAIRVAQDPTKKG